MDWIEVTCGKQKNHGLASQDVVSNPLTREGNGTYKLAKSSRAYIGFKADRSARVRSAGFECL